jgi:cell wall-associated NlpC family hydrolase
MSRNGDRIVARARALVGTRFRPQGRDPMLGLDCVGAAAFAAGMPADAVRRDYALRGQALAQIEHDMCDLGCQPIKWERIEPGDFIVCETGPGQFHIIIATPGAFVHADAALRRVVERPLPLPWKPVGVWRSADQEEE